MIFINKVYPGLKIPLDLLYLVCQVILMFSTLLHLSPVNLLPQNLQSLLPLEPIEDPNSWAWANHPRQGFSYKSKDSLSVEVCLQNPKLIATAKCQLPLDVCLSNPQFIAQVGCSGSEITPTHYCVHKYCF